MSSPQLKPFEGRDPASLLERIYQELGPEAKITGGETVRSGGLLGFFAQERFRLYVELPPEVELHRTRDQGQPSRNPSHFSPSPRRRTAARQEANLHARMSAGLGPTGDIFAMLAEATSDLNDVAATPTPAHHPVHSEPGSTDESSGDCDFAEVLSAAAAMMDRTDEPSPPPPSPRQATAIPPGMVGQGWMPPSEPSWAAQSGDPREAPPALGSVGLDKDLIIHIQAELARGRALDAVLLEVFSRMNAAPPLPRRPGSLVVVVGAGARARRVAAALANTLGTDPDTIPFATPDAATARKIPASARVRSAQDAAERAPSWRLGRIGVCAVDAPVGGKHNFWARHVIASARPSAVWGAVDAFCKPEDIAAWAAAVGGLDALAVEELMATVSPAAVLAAGIPVALLDGQPATPARWVATVVDAVDTCR